MKVVAPDGTITNTPSGRLHAGEVAEAIPRLKQVARLEVEEVIRVGSSQTLQSIQMNPDSGPRITPAEAMPYAALDGNLIRETIRRLELRIGERFPGSGLGRVSAELGRLASAAEGELERLRRPMWLPRIGAALGILGMLAIAAGLIMIAVAGSLDMGGLSEFLQGIEAAANEVILLAVGLFFMLSIETRVKRRVVLKALYHLRSLIHVVDMHQLTKDPEFVISPEMATATSPERTLTRFEMVRYLDYCSELFSLTSKVATLYLQHVNDAVVLAAVNDIESLSNSLSHKVWQKIMILDDIADPAGYPEKPATR